PPNARRRSLGRGEATPGREETPCALSYGVPGGLGEICLLRIPGADTCLKLPDGLQVLLSAGTRRQQSGFSDLFQLLRLFRGLGPSGSLGSGPAFPGGDRGAGGFACAGFANQTVARSDRICPRARASDLGIQDQNR